MHKKYTYKDGKKYGPYLYENKRVGERVFTKYVGKENPINDFNKRQIIAFFLILVSAILFIISMNIPNSSPTGKVSLEVDTVKYNSGELLSGVVKFNLKKGEFVPSDSKVKVKLDGQEREYVLKDIARENKKEGEFYAENSNLFGSGEGYGEVGEQIINPEIEFELLLVNSLGEEEIISGKVSKGKDFVYSGEYVSYSIVSGSVKVDGKEAEFSAVSSEDNNKEIRITTNYEVIKEGYGKDYLGDFGYSLDIELDDFNLTAVNDVLNVELSYGGEIIASAQKEIIVNQEENLDSSENTQSGNELTIKEEDEEVRSISITKNISNIKIPNGRTVTLNLDDYFLGASSYSIEVSNDIVANIDSGILSLSASEGFKGTREARIKAISSSDEVESNLFEIIASSGSINIATSRSQIKLGENVKWTKNVTLQNPESISIEIPIEAENIEVRSVDNGEEKEVDASVSSFTGNVVIEIDLKTEEEKPKKSTLSRFFKNIFDSITGNVVSEVNVNDVAPGQEEVKEVLINDSLATEYVIEYETPAPEAQEFETANGKTVIISAPDNLGYTDVLSYTSIPEIYSLEQENMIKIYWVEDGSFVSFDAYDLDTNGKIDYIEWITPHLSNQTFEIILITNAVHLDSNKAFLEDVYNIVSVQDGNYVSIPSGDYVRVTFEKNLTSDKDITLYARSIGAQVEVYEKDGTEILMTFDVSSEGEYKKYLTNLIGEQDTFDLKVVGASVEFDLIIDPSTPGNINSCQMLDVAGTYILTQDINNVAGTCFEITVNGVILDGNGYAIDGDDSGGENGIVINSTTNVVVKNFRNITDFYNGIYLYDSANNTIISNLSSSSNINIGIYVYTGSNNTLSNITSNYNDRGVVISSSLSNRLLNITSNHNSDIGISLSDSSSNNILSNIIVNSNSGDGIYLSSSSNNNILSNLNSNNNNNGISFSSSSNNTLSNITTNFNTFEGIYMGDGYNNTLSNINASSNDGNGISLGTSSNNTFSNVTANYNVGPGIYLYSSLNNTFSNVTANLNTDAGIYLYANSHNNELLNVKTISNNNHGLVITTSSNNEVHNINSSLNLANGIYLSSSSNNTLSNITSFSNSMYGLFSQESQNNTFTNFNSYNNTEQEIYSYDWVSESGSLDNQLIYDNENGRIEFDALTSNIEGNIIFSDQEGAGTIVISENSLFVDSENVPGLNIPATVTIKGTSSFMIENPVVFIGDEACFDCNSTPLDAENVVLEIPHWTEVVLGDSISTCNVMISSQTNTAAKYYVQPNLTRNDANSVCISISKSRVSLFGNNSVIDGIDTPESIGVYANVSDISLVGLNVSDYDYGIYLNSSSSRTLLNISVYSNTYGLYLNNVSNRIIRNVYAYGNENGIYLTSSNNNSLTNISANSNNNQGIVISSSANNSFVNVNASSNSIKGIYLVSSSNNSLSNVDSSFNANPGIYLELSSNNTLSNITADFNVWGLMIMSSNGNVLSNITSNSNSQVGVYMDSSSANTLTNVIANSNTLDGISLTLSNYNLLSSIESNSNSQSGVYLLVSSNNTLSGVNSSSNSIKGIFFMSSENNIFSNLNINSNIAQGIDISGTSNNNTFSNISAHSNLNGITFAGTSSNNTFDSGIINYSRQDAIYITNSVNRNNIFVNISISQTNSSNRDIRFLASSINGTQLINMPQIGNYSFAGTGSFIVVKETGYGEIKFLRAVNGSGTNFSANIQIANNSIYINSSQTGLNKSANITLYNLARNFVNPNIYKDEEICTNCYNFTSLNAGNVTFNVTSGGNYTISETQIGTPPSANSYEGYGGTDFSQIVIYTNVTNLTLVNSYGKIQFPSNYGVDASGEDYDSNVNIGPGYVGVNSDVLDQSFNSSTNITIYGVTCPAAPYYTDDFLNSYSTLGTSICNEFTDPACTYIVCNEVEQTLSFTASHFTSFVEQFSCGVLNESDTVYTLQGNITNYAGTCFNITANNVTLDGAGYTISGTNDPYNIYWGVLAQGRNNITIKNLTITNFGDTLLDFDTTDDGGGVKLYNTNNSFIYNVSTSGGNTGISFENSYNNDVFSVNSSTDYKGIKLVNSLYNSFEGYSLASTGADLYCSSSNTNYNYGLNYSTQDPSNTCDAWISSLYLMPGNISSCGVLNRAGTYNLENDILDNAGTCFNITADNITLNGNDYKISSTTLNDYVGVYADRVSNIIIENMDVDSFGYGIYSYSSINVSILSNEVNESTYGIRLDLTNESLIYENYVHDVNGPSQLGIGIYSSSNNNISNNVLIGSTGSYLVGNAYGIYIESGVLYPNIVSFGNKVFNNYLSHFTYDENSGRLIYLNGAEDVLVIDSEFAYNNISSDPWRTDFGIYASYANNISFRDSVIAYPSAFHIYLSNAHNINLTNVSYLDISGDRESFSFATNFTRNWYFDINVTGNDTGLGISGANVTVYSSRTGLPIFSALTNSNGRINTTIIAQYWRDFESETYTHNPINVTVSAEGYGLTNITLDIENNVFLNASLSNPYLLTSCSVLSEEGATYTLQNDIIDYASDCFNITANNIVLDLNNYTVDGTNDGNNAYYAIYASGRNNITIKNGKITEFGDLFESSVFDGGAIKFIATNNSNIENINHSYNYLSIYLTDSNLNRFENISSVGNSQSFSLYNSLNNTFNYISSENSFTSIGLYTGSNNTNVSNVYSVNSQFGVEVNDAHNNYIYNVTSNGAGTEVGVRLYNSLNNRVNRVNSYSLYDGVVVSGGQNNTIYNINSSLSAGQGVSLSSTRGNILENITSLSNTGNGIYVTSSHNNSLRNLTLLHNSNGINVEYSENNSLRNIYAYNNTGNGIIVSGSFAAPRLYNFIDNVNSFDNGYGGIVLESQNNTLSNINASNNAEVGLFLSNTYGANNSIYNATLNNNDRFGLVLSERGNKLYNITALNNNEYDFIQSSVGANDSLLSDFEIGNYWRIVLGKLSFENSNYGKIDYLVVANGSGSNLSSDIQIANNSVYINSSKEGLNKSANITLYGLSTSYSNPVIYKDGSLCTNCYNFTSLNAGSVKFNVTSGGNYHVGEEGDYYSLTECGVLSEAGETYTLQNDILDVVGNCFVITANDITLNGNYSNNIEVTATLSSNGYGVVAENVTNITIRNIRMTLFRDGIYLSNVSNSTIKDNFLGSSTRYGINLIGSVNNSIYGNDLENNAQYQLLIGANSQNNYFINNSFLNSQGKSIFDNSGNLLYNYMIYHNNYGRIEWNNVLFNRNLSTESDLSIGESIILESNNVGVNPDSFATGTSRIDTTSANITLYNAPAFNGQYRSPLFGIRENEEFRCTHCYNFTNLHLGGTVVFNVSYMNGNYSIGLAPRSKQKVPLGRGWNLFGLTTDDNYSESANVTITLYPGSNYIAYSGANNISKDNVTVTLSDGTELNWGQTVQLFKAYNLFGYYETQEDRKRFKYAGLDDDKLRVGKGYIIEVNNNVSTGGIAAGDYINITFIGAGGSRTDDTYAWADLMFMNETSGEVKNITEAATSGWVEGTLQYWDPTLDDGIGAYGLIQTTNLPASGFKNTISSWEGIQAYSNSEDIVLIRQD